MFGIGRRWSSVCQFVGPPADLAASDPGSSAQSLPMAHTAGGTSPSYTVAGSCGVILAGHCHSSRGPSPRATGTGTVPLRRRRQSASVVARTVSDLCQLKIGCHFLTVGVRPGQQGRNVAADCGGRADHHWQREAETPIDREPCYGQWHQAAEDRSLMVAEGRRGGPHFGGEALVHISGDLLIHGACEGALQRKEDRYLCLVAPNKVQRRHQQANSRRYNHCPT